MSIWKGKIETNEIYYVVTSQPYLYEIFDN